MFEFFSTLFAIALPEQVVLDDGGVTRFRPDGHSEYVAWDDLVEVELVTTDEGPFVEDVFFLLIGEKGGCAVPQGAKGTGELLERLQQLPGFDNEAVIRGMGCTDNARFCLWKRAAA